MTRLIQESGQCFVLDDMLVCLNTSRGRLVPFTTVLREQGLSRRADVFEVSFAEFIRHSLGVLKPVFPLERVREGGCRYVEANNAEDLDFAFRLFEFGLGAKVINAPLYFYRVRAGSSAADSRLPEAERAVYERLLANPAIDSRSRRAAELKLREVTTYLPFARSVKSGDWVDALRMAATSPNMIIKLARAFPGWVRRRWAAYRCGAEFR